MIFSKRGDRFAAVSAYYGIPFESFDMPVHTHEAFELMYIQDGFCKVWADGNERILQKNQLILLDSQTPHRLLIEKGAPCCVLCVETGVTSDQDGLDLREVTKNCTEFSKLAACQKSFIVLEASGQLCFAVKDLISEQEKGAEKNGYLCNILLAKLLIELARCYESSGQTSGVRYLRRAKAFIQKNYSFDISVAQVAQVSGVHPAYLQTLFKQTYGCGIKTFIHSLRMEKASFLLRNTNLSITEIAFETGYNSRQHFGYTFEKKFGQSPMQYRKLKSLVMNVNTKTFKNT